MSNKNPDFLEMDEEDEQLEMSEAEKSASAGSQEYKQSKRKKSNSTKESMSLPKFFGALAGGLIVAGVAVFFVINALTASGPNNNGFEGTDASARPDSQNDNIQQRESERVSNEQRETSDRDIESRNTEVVGMNELDKFESVIEAQGQRITELNDSMERLANRQITSGDITAGMTDEERETVFEAIKELKASQESIQKELASVSKNAQGSIQKVAGMMQNTQAKVSVLSDTMAQLKAANKKEEQPVRVTGDDIEIMSVTNGFAFLRYVDDKQSEFSLRVGEQLRGYGQVERITALGCIYAGGEKLEPQGGVCEL